MEGHAGHMKNEYANDLAIRAATEQVTSPGLVPSALDAWLAQRRERGQYTDHDPDREFAAVEAKLGSA